jgi:tetratricopeptide (TPR) repeat protein
MVGLSFIEEAMYAEAANEFRSILSKSPNNDQARYLLASVLFELGEKQEARENLLKILPGSQQYVDSRLFLCAIMVEDNQKEESLDMLEAARRHSPQAPQLVLAQATILEEMGRFKEAKAIYTESLANFPDEAEIRFRLGYVEDKLGEKDACISAMKKAVEIDPNHAEALNYLAYTWAEKGENLSEALSFALKANALKPDNGYIVDTVAWIYYVMGDIKKSLPLLEKAANLSEEDPVIMEHLGDALSKLGRLDEAKRAYGKAVEKGHESPEVINEKLQNISK